MRPPCRSRSLPELAAYRDLVLAVAKALFQGRNPQRQRLPKGFEGGFRLVLDRVEPGSAVPNVCRVVDEALSLFPGLVGVPDLFDEARDPSSRPSPPSARECRFRGADAGHPGPLQRLRQDAGEGRDPSSWPRPASARAPSTIGASGAGSCSGRRRRTRRRCTWSARCARRTRTPSGSPCSWTTGAELAVRSPSLFLPRAIRSLGEEALVRVRGTGLFDAEGTLQRVTMASDVSLARGRGGAPVPPRLPDAHRDAGRVPEGPLRPAGSTGRDGVRTRGARLARPAREGDPRRLPRPDAVPVPDAGGARAAANGRRRGGRSSSTSISTPGRPRCSPRGPTATRSTSCR